MSGRRQKNRPEQEVLAFPAESRSDAPKAAEQGSETLMAKRKSESLAGTERRMEEVCELENCKQALQRVKANKGSLGVPEAAWVEDRGTATKRNLSTAAGKTGGNPEAGRQWNAQARHSLRAGSLCPAGGVAGSAEALGPDVLRT